MYRLSPGDFNAVVVKLSELLQEGKVTPPFVRGTMTDWEDKKLELNMCA
jgi:hypothetical protein